MASPRRTLGKYELVARIGEGGMAEVHLARQRGPRKFQKIVVVKTVHSKLATRPALAEALLDEARIAAMVKHPNVIDIYDLGEKHGTYFIAMEYLEGESLAAILRASRLGPRLDPFSTARIVADAAGGLHAAHELRNLKGEAMELVHQDVTPGNVIVLYTGQVKLVDFGVAKVRTSADAGLVRGKAGYLAPELFDGHPADRRSDVFALGVVLWEALTLRRLFHSLTERETFEKIRTGQVVPPSRHAPLVTKDLDDVCMRALARDPTARYQTARAMHDDLVAVLRAANWGGDNEPIARFMRTTFATQIAARAELLRELDADEDPRAEVLEQITAVGFDPAVGSPPGDDGVVIGAHGAVRLPLPPPRAESVPPGEDYDPGEAEIIEVTAEPGEIAIEPAKHPRRKKVAFGAGLGAAALIALGVIAIAGRASNSPSALAAGQARDDSARMVIADDDQADDDRTKVAATTPVAIDRQVAPPVDVARAPAVDRDRDRDDRRRSDRRTKGRSRHERRVADKVAPPESSDEVETRLVTAKSLTKDGIQRFVGGDTAGAISQFQAALARDPQYAPAHRGLGMAYERKGNRAGATKAFRKYLELAPSASDADQIRDRLAKLR